MNRLMYYIKDFKGTAVPVYIRPATNEDYFKTRQDRWQTSWKSKYIQNKEFKKYAIIKSGTNELIALGAYYDDKANSCIHVVYAEAAPRSNPTIVVKKENRMYYEIGKVIFAFGVELSLKNGYDGTIYFKAKNTKLYKYYKKEFGAVDLPAGPYLLILYDVMARSLLNEFVEEEDFDG